MKRTLLALLCLSAACGATTNVVGTWREPTYTGRAVQRVMVIGLTPNRENQQKFEYALAAELERMKIKPFTGFDLLPREKMADRETIVQLVKQNQVDVLVVTTLVAMKSEQEYVPPSVGYAPPATHYGMYPYYAGGYSTVYSPGYVRDVKVVYLETNAYDAKLEKLVWSGVTKTFDYSSVDSVVSSVAPKIAQTLYTQGIF